MSKKQKRILWPMMTVMVLVLAAVAFVATRNKTLASPKAEAIAAVPHRSLARGTNVLPGPMHVVRFTLYDAGIYPREVRVDAGLVAITIEDFSGGTSGLVVAPEIGSDQIQLGVVQRFEHDSGGRSEMTMTAGRYVVFDSSRPSNRAKLIVEP